MDEERREEEGMREEEGREEEERRVMVPSSPRI